MVISQINDKIFSIRTIDKERELFDQLIPLPDGTSYNAYFVKGSEKTALIDTTYPPKIDEFLKDLEKLQIDKLDFIVSNHAEQDHSGAIPQLLELYPDAKVVTNAKCKALLIEFLNICDDRIITINDKEILSLGDISFEFILAPWVHWPDTMFTYVKEYGYLFTCDFLGAHLATEDLYVENKDLVYESAKRYYAEIMMPFRNHVKKHVETVKNMNVSLILPSHGPVHKDPNFILDAYKDWSSDNVKNEVVIAYLSMYESTKMMVDYVAKSLKDRQIEVRVFDIINADIGDLAVHLVDAATLIIASPIVLAGPHPNMAYAAYLVNALKPKIKYVSVIGSYGWGGNMADQLKNMLGNLKAEFIDPVLVKGLPKAEGYQYLDELIGNITEKHNSLILTEV